MTIPLVVLAVSTVLLGVIGTPAWPWFEAYLAGHPVAFDPGRLGHAVPLMVASAVVVAAGIGLGWALYGRRPRVSAEADDVLVERFRGAFRVLGRRMYVDELYSVTLVAGHSAASHLMAWLDQLVIGGLVQALGWLTRGCSFVARWIDELFVNAGFDAGCGGVGMAGRLLSRVQNGQGQRYLALLGLGMAGLAAAVIWGIRAG